MLLALMQNDELELRVGDKGGNEADCKSDMGQQRMGERKELRGMLTLLIWKN